LKCSIQYQEGFMTVMHMRLCRGSRHAADEGDALTARRVVVQRMNVGADTSETIVRLPWNTVRGVCHFNQIDAMGCIHVARSPVPKGMKDES
jgi:hypothetical protein